MSMSPSFKRADICLTLEYGHPCLLWDGVERLATGHVVAQQLHVGNRPR